MTPHGAGIAAVALAERQIAEQPWDALVEHGAVIAARLVAERAGQPTLADPCGAFDDHVLRLLDPSPAGEGLEEGAVEPARRAVVDVLDRRLVAQTGIAPTGLEPPILTLGGLMVEKTPEPFGVGQVGRVWIGGEAREGTGHAVQAKPMERSRVGWVSTA